MSQNITWNNVVYPIPTQGDLRWAAPLDRYLVALGTYALSPAGGTFTLTANVNFGTSFGLLSKFYSSSASNPASAGLLRLSNLETVSWRNFNDNGNLALSVNSSDQLLFNGSALNQLAIPVTVPNGGTGVTSTTAYGVLIGGTTSTNPLQNVGPGSLNQVLTSSGPGAAPIWSAAGTGTVGTGTQYQLAYYASSTNAVDGLTLIIASRALASDSNGLPVASATTATELGYVNGVTSAIQTQIDAKAPSASPTFTGTVTLPVTADRALQTGTASVLEASTVTKTELGYVSGVTSAIQTQLNAKGTGTVTSVSGTSNQIAVATGTTTPVISITSPVVLPGAATVTGNLTFSPTTAGIVGTTTNDNTAAGNVGQYVESVVSAVSYPSTGTYGDLASISLTAGDWDVTGINVSLRNGATVAETVLGISTTSGNSQTGLVVGSNQVFSVGPTSTNRSHNTIGSYRMSLNGTTTVYLKFSADFTVATPQASGRISARRVR